MIKQIILSITLIISLAYLPAEATTTNKPKVSRAIQNYQCGDQVNSQIKTEFDASNIYLSLANYFSHDLVSLQGFGKWFEHSAHEEREHAQKLIDYSLKRGFKVVTPEISKPENDTEWEKQTACEIVNVVLGLEMKVHQSLLNLHSCAEKDPHLQDFIEAEYLTEQVDANKEIADLLTRLERATTIYDSEGKPRVVCDGLGLHLVDKELAEKYGK